MEDLTVVRNPLRLLESPWQRKPLRSIDETFAGSVGNLAARGLGAVFNTRGHRLRSAAADREYRDQMRQHYSDSPEALKHLEPEFQKRAADQSQKATHGRLSRLFFGDPSQRNQAGGAASTTTSHTPPAELSGASKNSEYRTQLMRGQSKPDSAPTAPAAPAAPQTGPTAADKYNVARLHGKAQSIKAGHAPAAAAAAKADAPLPSATMAPKPPKANPSISSSAAKVRSMSGGVAPTALGTKPPANAGQVARDVEAQLRGAHGAVTPDKLAQLRQQATAKQAPAAPAQRQTFRLSNVMAQLTPEQQARANAQATANKASKLGQTVAGGNIKGKVDKLRLAKPGARFAAYKAAKVAGK